MQVGPIDDVPTLRKRSHASVTRFARVHSFCGRFSPNQTKTDSSAAVTAARWLDYPLALGFIWNVRPQNMRTATGVANAMMQRAVQLKNLSATGALMQIIDILGYQSQLRHFLRQPSDCEVSFVWRPTQRLHTAPLVPAPDEGGLLLKAPWVANSSAWKRSQSPDCGIRKVESPLSTEMPAPVSTTTCLAALSVSSSGIGISKFCLGRRHGSPWVGSVCPREQR
jgi:hypothetical protein